MANPPKSVFEQPPAATLTHDEPPPVDPRLIQDRSFFGHPRGLSTLFFTEMWERFSYYGIRPLLVLFMIAALADGGFGFERTTASSIAGIYAFSVYLASLPGGWIADRWLGLRRSIWYGGVFIALGHLSIALSVVFAHRAFFLGLVFIVIGTGLLKPNISAIVGDLYPEGGARRDAGFSIFYMGINTGALIAPIVTGFLGERVGWHLGFGAAGVGMVIGLITYRLRAPGTLGPIGIVPSAGPEEQRRVRTISLGALGAILLVVVLGMFGAFRINAVYLANLMLYLVLGMAVLYFGYLFLLAGLTTDEKKRMAVIMVLFVFAMIFWSAFEQAPTSLNLFARDFTDRVVFGWEVPATWVQLVNPLFVIIFAPVFAVLWVGLARRGVDLASPAKFGFGVFFAGLGFLVMVLAANRVISAGGALRVSLLWLIASYLLQTWGELSLSPVGLSSMTKLAPRRFVGQMMGVWFTAAALGNLIAGIVGGNVDPEKLQEMPRLFMRTSVSLFIAAGVIWALVIPIRRMMRDVPAHGR
ncbi:MAG: peptide MFS transporter [Gemmatimonadota bacterium]|nr:peptide MFS transporter [Gemmatimonadota bacterium]